MSTFFLAAALWVVAGIVSLYLALSMRPDAAVGVRFVHFLLGPFLVALYASIVLLSAPMRLAAWLAKRDR